jgi:hypothetical protein
MAHWGDSHPEELKLKVKQSLRVDSRQRIAPHVQGPPSGVNGQGAHAGELSHRPPVFGEERGQDYKSGRVTSAGSRGEKEARCCACSPDSLKQWNLSGI